MATLRVIWDPKKNATNLRKHGVSLEEAQSVFSDDHGLLLDDPEHSEQEDRFVLLGMSASARLLVTCHCYRENDDVVRIISARRANATEQTDYAERFIP